MVPLGSLILPQYTANTSNHYFYFIQEIRRTHLHKHSWKLSRSNFIYFFEIYNIYIIWNIYLYKFEIYSNLYKYMFEIKKSSRISTLNSDRIFSKIRIENVVQLDVTE